MIGEQDMKSKEIRACLSEVQAAPGANGKPARVSIILICLGAGYGGYDLIRHAAAMPDENLRFPSGSLPCGQTGKPVACRLRPCHLPLKRV